MKKIKNYLLMAAMVCGISFITASCSDDDNTVTPIPNLSEKIIGKWIMADADGQPAPTNDKSVITFLSSTRATVSVSRDDNDGTWSIGRDYDVAVNGNNVKLTSHSEEHQTVVYDYIISDIKDSEMLAYVKMTISDDGNVVYSREGNVRFVKTANYSADIVGLWECTELTGGETYNNANARLEFLADGTYRYYRKDDNGIWQTMTTREFQNYFVDGTLLATRWKNVNEAELREWWEISSLSSDKMVWTALRKNADGSTFRQEMRWKKVELNVAENIIGKWMKCDQDGQPLPTDEKMVYTFVSPTKAYMSASIDASPEVGTHWVNQLEAGVTISGNKVSLTSYSEEGATMVVDYIITAIDDKEFTANHKVTITLNGNVVYTVDDLLRFEKVTADYSADIIGTWECQEITGGETYNDPNARLEFKSDGTYNFYRKDGSGQWQVVTTREFQNYFVDGYLVNTRWKDTGEEENREWWEISSLSGDQMVWTALRKNESGTTFVQETKWKKID